MLIGKLICMVMGHQRGKRVVYVYDGVTIINPGGMSTFACPRCGQTWSRKARKVKGLGVGQL